MSLIPLDCPSCGANLTVDSNKDAAICEYCGKPYIVKDAIVHNYINNVTNINADTVNVYSEKDFTIRAGVLEKYSGESVDVIIPNNVKIVYGNSNEGSEFEGAFQGCAIESVVIPESVTSIEWQAFCNCSSLTSVTIPDSVTKIGPRAFYGCRELTKIFIPDSVVHLDEGKLVYGGGYTFCNCSKLREVRLPQKIKEIAPCLFADCYSLEKVEIPESVTNIEQQAFYNCSSLTSITIPDSVEKIGESAFEGCHNPLTLKTSIGTFEVNPDELSDTSIEEVKQKHWMKQNKCTACGGDFTGFLIKKCLNCGKKKDY